MAEFDELVNAVVKCSHYILIKEAYLHMFGSRHVHFVTSYYNSAALTNLMS